jgi:hypothetical protein
VPRHEHLLRQAARAALWSITVSFTPSAAICAYDSGSARGSLEELASKKARYWESATMLDLTAGQVMMLLMALAAAIVFAVAWHVWKRD